MSDPDVRSFRRRDVRPPGSLVRIPWNEYAELRVSGDVFVARAARPARIRQRDILGKVLHARPSWNPGSQQAHAVDALVEPWAPAWPPATGELVWPYLDLGEATPPDWEAAAEPDELARMIADERPVSEAIADFVASRLPPDSQLLDAACSHGLCLELLAERRPDVVLEGTDLASAMVECAQQRVPAARIRIGDARAPRAPSSGAPGWDAIVLRGASQDVMSRQEALETVEAACQALRPEGLLVVHSFSQPRIEARDLESRGEVVERLHRLDERVAPFYALVVGARESRATRRKG